VIGTLIRLVVLQLVRERYVHAVIWVSLLFFLFCIPLGSLSFEEQERVLFHFGFLAVQLTTLGLGLVIGSGRLNQELERQTSFLILARPVSRLQFYFGMALGQIVVLALICYFLSFVLELLLRFYVGLSLPWSASLQVATGILFEAIIVMVFATMMSLFVRPTLAFFASFGLFLIGNWLPDMDYFATKSKDPLFIGFSKVFSQISPQLFRLNFRSLDLMARDLLPFSELGFALLHGLFWMLTFGSLGFLIFRRKDLV